MHHVHHTVLFSSMFSRVSFRLSASTEDKLTHQYNTRSNYKKRMEQENQALREEVSALRLGLDRVTTLVETLVAAESRPQPTPPPPGTPPPGQPQVTVVSEIAATPAVVAPAVQGPNQMPQGYPWGMPYNFTPEGYQPAVEVPFAQPMMTIPQPVTHVLPQEDQVYHTAASDVPDVYERMDGFQDQFAELRREMKAMKGKELFGKNTHDLCLVPNVKIPVKFKVPDFEKYKGNSYPQSHLIMYCRKMAMHTDDDNLLIH